MAGLSVTESNVRDGLYVEIYLPGIESVLGYGEVCGRISGQHTLVRILEITAPGLLIKPKHVARASLTELQQRFPDGIEFHLKNLRIAARFDPPVSASTVDTQEDYEEEQNQVFTRVKLDPMHWITRVTSSLDSGHSAYFDYCRVLRDAVFILDDGDKQRVADFLQNIGETFEQRFSDDPEWVLRYVRRTIPQPSVLEERICAANCQFENVLDPKTQMPLFPKGFSKIMDNALVHVRIGCLSDPSDVQLYYELPQKDPTALPAFRCIRGTTSNEGTVHQKLIPAFGAQNAGPPLAYRMLLDFVTRLNMKAAIRNKGEYNHGHFDPWLLDELAKVMADFDESQLAGWLPTSAIRHVESFPFLFTPFHETAGKFEPFD